MSNLTSDINNYPPFPPVVIDAVDNHTHVNMCGVDSAAELKVLVQRAQRVGVKQLITVGTDVKTSEFAVNAADWHPNVYAAVAIHPTDANKLDKAAKSKLTQLAQHPKTVAIGETGLDYYWITKSITCPDKITQRESFIWHIELARKVNKPIMIHDRLASLDVLNLLNDVKLPEVVVMHCFSGNMSIALECIKRGYYLSFSGTLTFKNAPELHEIAKIVPEELLLTETDAPFLTPHPYRGKTNESYCLPYTIAKLAELRNCFLDKIASQTANNARRIYNIPRLFSS